MVFTIKNYRYLLSTVCFILAIVTVLSCGFLLFRYTRLNNNSWEQAKQEAISETNNTAKELSDYIAILKEIATSIANELSENDLDETQIEALLRKKKIDSITAVGVSFLPYKYDKNIKLFAREVAEKDGKATLIKIEDLYDYTDKKNMWFNQPIKEGSGFLEPYHNTELDTMLAEYSVPIYRTNAQGKREVVGLAFASQSIQHLQHIIETLFLGNMGYWFILTDKGSFLAYPQQKYQLKTIFDIAKDLKNNYLANAAQKIVKGESVVFEYNNEITGSWSWLISSKIPNTPWSVVGVFDQQEFNLDSNLFRHTLMLPSIAFLLAIIFFSLAMALMYNNVWIWSFLSILISLSIFVQITWMWYAAYHYPYKENESNIYRVQSKRKLFEYLKENFPHFKNEVDAQYQNLTLEERILKMVPYKQYIPTGIYINSLQLSETNEIKISAYFWQRMTRGLHDKIPPGFVFIQTNEANIIEETAVMQGEDKLITYDVFAKLNQFLTYKLYPFDMKSLRIKYWAKTSSETFYFIPDFSSYQLINPSSLPGIDPDVYMSGWQLLGSYFGYQKLPYTNNFGAYLIGSFGVYDEDDLSIQPQPFFEIVIRRNLLDSLVSDLIPIAVIALLLFLVLFVITPERYLNIIASIFFATIFAHIRFRSKIPQAQIVYLENLYFILYIVMLVLLVYYFIIQNKIKIRYLTTHNNILIKMLYWPIFLGSFVVITLVYLW